MKTYPRILRLAALCGGVLFLLAALLPDAAEAQRRRDDCDCDDRYDRYDDRYDRHRYRSAVSNTRGFFLSGYLTGAGLAVEQIEAGGGSGIGLKIGYAPSRLLTFYVGFDGAILQADEPFLPETAYEDEFGLAMADLGMQLNFGGGRSRLVPYADVALSAIAAVYDTDPYDNRYEFDRRGRYDDEPDVTLAGGGLSFGGGLRYFMSRTVALDGGLALSAVEFNELHIEGERYRTDFDAGSLRLRFGIAWYPSR